MTRNLVKRCLKTSSKCVGLQKLLDFAFFPVAGGVLVFL